MNSCALNLLIRLTSAQLPSSGKPITHFQVTDQTFTNLAEHQQWFEDKTDEFLSQHPERKHDNWRLTERFYRHDQGRTKAASTEIGEKMERNGSDGAAAAAAMMLCDEGDSKSKKKDPGAQHKASLTRTRTMIARLSKSIGALEEAFPSLRRTIPTAALNMAKQGLMACRQAKPDCLDEMEECKSLPDDPTKQEEVMRTLAETQAKVSEHLSAITEVLQKHKAAPIVKVDPSALADRPDITKNPFPYNRNSKYSLNTVNLHQKCLGWLGM